MSVILVSWSSPERVRRVRRVVAPRPVDEAPDIRCCVCASPDWWRCDPGRAADASPLTPGQRQAVLLLPGGEPDVPPVAWCVGCDPLIVAGPERLSAGDAEYRSWGVL
jgi:hypothetical protein